MDTKHRQQLDGFHQRYRTEGYTLTVATYHDRKSETWRCGLRVFTNGRCVRTAVLGKFTGHLDGLERADKLTGEARKYLNDLAAPGCAGRAAAKSGRMGPPNCAPAVVRSE